MNETQRNFAILAAIAIVVVALGQGEAFGRGANTVLMVLHIAFLAVICYALFRLYRRHQDTINSLSSGVRLQLQAGAIGGLFVLLTGLLFPGWAGWSGLHALLFFGLVGGCIYAVYNAWQQRPYRW